MLNRIRIKRCESHMKTEIAVLANGTRKPYVKVDNPPHGGIKHTYFAPDKSYVIQFFNDKYAGLNPDLRTRLEAIIGRYNPTITEEDGGAKGNNFASAGYFAGQFCWPIAIVTQPELGIMCPTYPDHFFFQSNTSTSSEVNLIGKDKRSSWFTTRNREIIHKAELGNFRLMLQISILLVRTVRRMHQAGLAHADLSCNNVLIDPVRGDCVVIDIDSLVVPGLFPPEVLGTPGYIAPEVLATAGFPSGDPRRLAPSVLTDLHSLAVLLYEYLLLRHPLKGPKVHSTESQGLDQFLAFGPHATFVEHPEDHSNRPDHLRATIADLGPSLEKLFAKSFVDGLHARDERPTALEWERGLAQTWDLLYPCSNQKCEQGWFVLHDLQKPICPFCQTRISEKEVLQFTLYSEIRGRNGQWKVSSQLIVPNMGTLSKWHVYDNVFFDEKADTSVEATVLNSGNQWLLVNENINGMVSPYGKKVPIGQAIQLEDGMVLRLTKAPHGRLLKVAIKPMV